MTSAKATQVLAAKMRISAVSMVHNASASHIGSALSICDIVVPYMDQ